jgi:sporulation protein YlmC with PRC-barrel domain
MTARMSLVAVLALIASPVFAQNPPATTDGNAPATQSDQAAPAAPAAPPAATEPAPAPAPPAAANKEAAAPPAAAPSSAVAASDLKKSEDRKKIVGSLNAPVDAVEEMDILDANGKKIAEVDSVLEDKNGEIKGVAIEYGGFLGFGQKGAVVTLDQVKLKDGNLVTELTAEQLPQLPAWNH